jgi:Ca-activated chloride channel family protein
MTGEARKEKTGRAGGGGRARAAALAAALVAMAAGVGAQPAADLEVADGTVRLADVEWAALLWQAGDGRYRPAPQLSAEVEIRVTGLVARARVTQRFANPGAGFAEGVYVFPLPETAAVDRLRMVVGERVIEGQVREKEEARQVYETARREGVRASLVEQHRPNVFSTRVANVAPGETVEVVLELQQAVDYDAGRLRLRFPTVVARRYFPGGERPLREGEPAPVAPGLHLAAGTGGALEAAGRRVVAAAEEVLDDLLPEPPPVNPLRLSVHLDAGFPLAQVWSPHHRVAVSAAGGRGWRVDLADGEVEADRDFELVWEPRPGATPRAALFTEEHDGDVYALLMVLPPDEGSAGWSPLAREVIFVLDTSGSMHGEAMDQAKAALSAALDRLQPWDTFNVVEFDDEARPLFPESLPADRVAVDQARTWVAGLAADGGTEMLSALALALDGVDPGYRRGGGRAVRQVVFLTDGAVGNEEELFAYIAAHLGDARLFTVGIGSAPNAYFMRRAAEVGRGSFTYVGSPDEVEEEVEGLARKLEGAVLTDLRVAWDDPGAESWPERLPDLYAGEPLVVATRLSRLGGEVRLSGQRDGVPWDLAVPLAAAVAEPLSAGAVHGGVRQLWARRKIDSLLGRLAEGVAEEEVRREVVDVALAHHLVSRYTSLVAVDVTPVRAPGEALVSGAVPVVLPAGQLPVGGTSSGRDLLLGVALVLLAAVGAWAQRPRRSPA